MRNSFLCYVVLCYICSCCARVLGCAEFVLVVLCVVCCVVVPCCGVVWCGVVWCGVVWCGVVWCGVVWCGGVVPCPALSFRVVLCCVPCRVVSCCVRVFFAIGLCFVICSLRGGSVGVRCDEKYTTGNKPLPLPVMFSS